MDIAGWNERYRQSSGQAAGPPTALVVQTARALTPGTVLDLACGTGRNALWLSEQGWRVTAVDGAEQAVALLRDEAAARGLTVDAIVADIETGEFPIAPAAWDFIVIAYYLQRDLFEMAKAGVRTGGVVLVIVHITEPGEEPTAHRLRPGELPEYFAGWEILHECHGRPQDKEHRRSVAEIVARKPGAGSREPGKTSKSRSL